MKRYDSVLVENYDHYLATMEKSDIGQYVRHEDVHKMLSKIIGSFPTDITMTQGEIINSLICIFTIEGFEVKK